MLRVLGDRSFDVTHRAVVVGLVDDDDPAAIRGILDEHPVALAVATSSERRVVCDRVDVPVGVVVSSDRIDFPGSAPIAVVGPFDGGPAGIAQIVSAVDGGARVLLSDAIRRDRRVAEVMARILENRRTP